MTLNRLLVTTFCALVALTSCGAAQTAPAPVVVLQDVARFDQTTLMLRFDPPPDYERWMEDVERCSGIARDPNHEDTYWVIPRRFLRINAAHDSATIAEHDFVRHQIRFGLGWEQDSSIVRHEMLHHLLWTIRDRRDHDPTYFVIRCAHEVGR